MIAPDTLAAFFAASVALAVAPGPDNLFVLAQSTLHGARAGLTVVLGLCTGLLVHTAVVALGLAALIRESPLAFTLLKAAGALYLLWLARGAWRAASAGATLQGGSLRAPAAARHYVRGIAMNVSNPKVTLFFLAFLPQFADPARGAVAPQVVALGGVFIAATLLVFGAVAISGARLGAWLARKPGAQVWLNRMAALVFAALAARLALED